MGTRKGKQSNPGLTDDSASLGQLGDRSLVSLGVSDISLGVTLEASVHVFVNLLNVLLQVLPDRWELAARGSDHGEVSDFASSSEIETGETDDTDLKEGREKVGGVRMSTLRDR